MEQGANEECSKEEVQSALQDAVRALEQSPAREADDAAVCGRMEALLADLRRCLEHVHDLRACVKWCSSLAFAHKHQVSTSADGSAYRNALQTRLADAARQEINVGVLANMASSEPIRGSRVSRGRRGRHAAAAPQQPLLPQVVIPLRQEPCAKACASYARASRVLCRMSPGPRRGSMGTPRFSSPLWVTTT